jgi:glutamate/tyrosine decarboxylase-like PLP-dependent enzyme
VTTAAGTSPSNGPPTTSARPTPTDALRDALRDPLPHPPPADLRAAALDALDWALGHYQTLPEQSVGSTAPREVTERLLREPPPEQPTDFPHVLHEFRSKVLPYSLRTNHPRFLAFVPSAPAFPAVLGDWLCAASNCFAGLWVEGAAPAQVELLVLDWFKDWLGYPPEARGLFTGGGSEANLTALVVARDRLPFDDRGRAVLYGSDHRHRSIDRAARVIGLHPDQLRVVPADGQFRLTPEALAAAVRADREAGRRPWLVAASAGATNTGTVDPLRPLAEFCRAEGLWLHADAAYGGPAVLTAEGRAVLDGIDLADSITLDAHKWLAQPYTAGCLLVRDGRLLPETFATHQDYLQDTTVADEDHVNFADYGLALTRRFRALHLWVAFKVLGVGWYRALVERCMRLADYAEQTLAAGPFEVLRPRQLSTVCFRYFPPGAHHPDAELDRLNLTILAELQAGGRAFLSSTRLNGRVAVRMCFINWRTTAADVDEVVRLLTEIGAAARG